MIKSLLSGMTWKFKHQDLLMFGLKLNNYELFSPSWKLWVAVARHKWKMLIDNSADKELNTYCNKLLVLQYPYKKKRF